MKRIFPILIVLAMSGIFLIGRAENLATLEDQTSFETTETDKKAVLGGIDKKIEKIVLLIPQFEGISAVEDVKKLKELQKNYTDFREKIGRITDPFEFRTISMTYGERSPALSDALEQISSKLTLPAEFNELSLSLKALQESRAVFWQESGLDLFLKGLDAKNGEIQGMSPKDRAQNAPAMIAQFTDANEESLSIIIFGNGGRWPENDLALRAQTAAVKVKAEAVLHEAPAAIGDPLPLRPHALGKAKALAIIVDSWLEAEDEYQDQFRISVPVEARALETLKQISEWYSFMSYGRFTWDFDICEVKGGKQFLRPENTKGVFESAMDLCQKQGGYKDFSKYGTIIVFPGERLEGRRGHTGRVESLKVGGVSYSFTWVSISIGKFFGFKEIPLANFDVGLLSHELGHALSLMHAHAYECGKDVYNKSCKTIHGPNDELVQGIRNYGDAYDILGIWDMEYLFQFGLVDNADFNTARANINCFFKSIPLGWTRRTTVGPGKHQIADLEHVSAKITQCLQLGVEERFVSDDAPCYDLFIEYRTPRKGRDGVFGGLALHCVKPSPSPEPFFTPYETILLDCTPGSRKDGIGNDIWDSLIAPGSVCHTNLGYDIGFTTNNNLGEVTITPTCNDMDDDGYYVSVAGCAPPQDKKPGDCNDDPKTGSKINPDAEEICDGVDNNCDKAVDKVPIPKKVGGKDGNEVVNIFNPQLPQGPGVRGSYVSVCSTCEDTDGENALTKGTVTVKRFGDVEKTCSDECGDIGGRNEDFWVTECLCKDQGLERVADKTFISCGNDRQCKDGACVERAVCKDADGDGLQSSLGICKLTTQEDCNDNDPKLTTICPCCDEDNDGFQVPCVVGCTMTGQADCDDKLGDVRPGIKEICGNQRDDNCNSRTDENCGQLQPIAMCNSVATAGGNWSDTRTFQLGKTSGSFTMIYTTYTIPDRIDVYYQTNRIWTSGCIGTGQFGNLGIEYTSAPISFNGTESTATVVVTPNCDPWNQANTTEWAYKLNCP